VNATQIGISRTHQYYKHKQPEKDWKTKQMIENALRDHPSYGHKRLAIHLKINKKRVSRVMKLFGIKPYRRTAKKAFVSKPKDSVFPNLLIHEVPQGPGDIYASDLPTSNGKVSGSTQQPSSMSTLVRWWESVYSPLMQPSLL